jgi:hypothetical protein
MEEGKMTVYLKKDEILKAQDFIFEDVDVPEWGGKVRIRCMTGSERDAYEASVYEFKGGAMQLNREDLRSKLLARVLVDSQNERLFTDAEVKLLGRKNAKVIDRLFTIAQRINALSDDDVKKLEKN